MHPTQGHAPWRTEVTQMALRAVVTAAPLWPFYVVMYAVGALHVLEVHVLDATFTGLVTSALEGPVHLFSRLEGPFFHALDAWSSPTAQRALTAYYLVGFVGLLAWAPTLVALTGDRARLLRTLLTYPALYAVALPGFLLLPQENPYVALGLADPFTPVHQDLERLYYLLTTPDNTFPSLHVAFTIALSVQLARAAPPFAGGVILVHAVLLVASVVLTRVHWVGDVVGGALAALFVLRLTDRMADGHGFLGRSCARLQAYGARTVRRYAVRRHRQRQRVRQAVKSSRDPYRRTRAAKARSCRTRGPHREAREPDTQASHARSGPAIRTSVLPAEWPLASHMTPPRSR